MPALERLDTRPLQPRPGELLMVTCVHDDTLRLPYLLEYYRALGVDRFFAIDNDSRDGSADFLLAQPDVHVFFTRESYAATGAGITWTNEVLSRYAAGHWTLTADTDELLVYPECETLGLRGLTDHLDRNGTDALACFLLDMYSDLPIRDTHYRSGTPFLSTCPYFDSDTYQMATEPPYEGLPMRGGARQRAFWHGRVHEGKPPILYKTPLVKWAAGLRYLASTHAIDGVRRGVVTGALLHFKLFSDMVKRVAVEARRSDYWDGGAQYSAYDTVLATEPGLSAWHTGAVKYEGSRQLERLGLLRRPPDYP